MAGKVSLSFPVPSLFFFPDDSLSELLMHSHASIAIALGQKKRL
jgi:hypothetical protein